MDFQNVNRLNVRLNMLSGNLLPMTGDKSLFPIAWRLYSAAIWLIKVTYTISMIFALKFVPQEKALVDSTVTFVMIVEVVFLFLGIYTQRDLAKLMIQKLNDVLRVQDETMKSIVRSTVKPLEVPLKFYWMAGIMSLSVWFCTPFALLYGQKKKYFFYEDYRIPAVFSKQPYSLNIFLLGSLISYIYSVYLFMKKVALDVYMINFVLLMIAQYRYIAVKLTMIFQKEIPKSHYAEFHNKYCFTVNQWAEAEIKALCRHHNALIQ